LRRPGQYRRAGCAEPGQRADAGIEYLAFHARGQIRERIAHAAGRVEERSENLGDESFPRVVRFEARVFFFLDLIYQRLLFAYLIADRLSIQVPEFVPVGEQAVDDPLGFLVDLFLCEECIIRGSAALDSVKLGGELLDVLLVRFGDGDQRIAQAGQLLFQRCFGFREFVRASALGLDRLFQGCDLRYQRALLSEQWIVRVYDILDRFLLSFSLGVRLFDRGFACFRRLGNGFDGRRFRSSSFGNLTGFSDLLRLRL